MNICVIGTTSHENNSTSRMLCSLMTRYLSGNIISFVDANKLHIVKNLSCYSSGGKNCASPEAGLYRCWAHFNSMHDPNRYGGLDEMPVIYDAINDSDIIIFSTSVRWGSHSAILQNIIERMNTLENRVTVYGEKSPLVNKRVGVVVTGQHWKAQQVGSHLLEVFGLMGFMVNGQSQLVWQNTYDMNEEQIGNNLENLAYDMSLEQYAPIKTFLKHGLGL